MTRSEFLTWLKGKHACKAGPTWVRATPGEPKKLWAVCPRGDWMLWLAWKARVERRLLVRAACACARGALVHVPASDKRPRRALEAAEAWARGEVDLAAVRRAARAVFARSTRSGSAAFAAYAAHDAACVSFDAAYAVTIAYDAAAAVANTGVYGAAYAASLAHSAELVRELIPWATIEAAIRSTP